MKYLFPICMSILLFAILFGGCDSLPGQTDDPKCYADSDCDDFSGARFCNPEGNCETCPDPNCIELPANCIYIPDYSTRCPECGTVDCIET